LFHLAAQVAVTTSLDDPRRDFDVNLGGTITLLEEVRRLREPPSVLFTSTNKVYGTLEDLPLVREGDAWLPRDDAVRAGGVGEDRPLAFCTPYGCSKGGADQYVLDYAKSYDIPAVVFRMSCIYGPHQHGTEDQGWVAHFLIQALAGRPITIYGDGAQVRDLLFVDDLVRAMRIASARAEELYGLPFNIGGGVDNAVSLLEVLEAITELTGSPPDVEFGALRTGDQRYYVSDTSRFGDATGWSAAVGVQEGLEALHAWLSAQRSAPVTPRPR
jgi:CDP-paratose 2-epimerase